MTLQFPVTFTWEQLASMPEAADIYGWEFDPADPEHTLAKQISYYNDSLTEKLNAYLTACGYQLTDTGVTITCIEALNIAATMFGRVYYEYDAPDSDVARVPRTLYGYTGTVWPTWALFDLSGDDDVDYNGTQPSCLPELLCKHFNITLP